MSLTRALRTFGSSAVLFGPTCLAGQPTTQKPIPIRQLGAAEARSRDTVNAPFGVRELSDGRLMVNDAGARRLLLFDASLVSAKVVADTMRTTSTGYGARGTAILAFTGDSTLFADIYSRAFLVIAPNGTVARTIAAPRANDVYLMANPSYGAAGIDPKGRLVYRAYQAYKERPEVTVITALQLDSAPIIRADFDTRSADTIALVGVPTRRMSATPLEAGRRYMQMVVNPLPLIDDWSMLPDGTVAVLRGQDYHLDWVNADGSHTSTPKMPFDWRRLSDDDKQGIVDSAKRAVEKSYNESLAKSSGVNGGGAPASAGVTSFGGGGSGTGANPFLPANFKPPMPEVVKPDELPDYIPPVLQSGTMRADPEGRVWILPSTSSQSAGGFLYDVVNRKGEIVERVRIPAGRVLAGFGARGVVYLTARDAKGNWLERARLVPTP